ncbi:MAG: 6-bladed beta-propeller [Acidobacteria bacterium]|nr:6-bladed beta-propeller [Acidobacteriota bacterium]
MNLRSIVAVLTLFTASACFEPLEFADWSLPVPDGTPVFDYAPVAAEEREGSIELVEDLVIGDKSDPNTSFYQIRSVAVDDEENIYVVEHGNHRIQVFGADGTFLRSFGRQGQGPGEFETPMSIVAMGRRLAVADISNAKISVFSLDGTHQADFPLPPSSGLLAATPAGSILGFTEAGGLLSQSWIPILFSADGQELRRFAELPLDRTPVMEFGGRRFYGSRVPRDRPGMAASSSGILYVSPRDQYQVLSYAEAGDLRWALRVAGAREPFDVSPELADEVVAAHREFFAEVTAANINWPEYKPIITGLAVDGHGHLFVSRYGYGLEAGDESPVDVYDADGARLFAGFMVRPTWTAARGDFVYGIQNDPEGEQVVVRSRLVEPFD